MLTPTPARSALMQPAQGLTERKAQARFTAANRAAARE